MVALLGLLLIALAIGHFLGGHLGASGHFAPHAQP
jgi:hypothetical protein